MRKISDVQDKLSVIGALCDRYSVARLEIFGSATREDFDSARSDLDFLVTFQEMSPREHRANYFSLLADLENLFLRPVDLIETPALENPYFLRAIEPTRIVLYSHDAT